MLSGGPEGVNSELFTAAISWTYREKQLIADDKIRVFHWIVDSFSHISTK